MNVTFCILEYFMDIWLIIAICIATAATLTLTVAYVCFLMVFHAPKKVVREDGYIDIPPGEIYQVHRPQITAWTLESRALPYREVEIKSFDGLTLRGKYFEHFKGAPIEILMHGYKGNSERDMSGGIFRSRDCGHNSLLVDHRASGRSDGKIITFGVNESRDCLAWIDFVLNEIDADARIILTGISMGAATVMNVSGMELPQNIIGVLADCGYTSAKDIIKKVIRDMHLPPSIFYPFVRLGGRIFAGFDLEELSPIEQVKKSKVPTIFFHGDADTFVPHYMSEENFAACSAEKKLVIIKGAGHGIAYPVDKELYLKEAKEFFEKIEN